MVKDLSVLLVDDDEDDRCIFGMAISTLPYNISLKAFQEGPAALQHLGKKLSVPDFIFLDLNMPVMNGYVCLQAIRELPHQKNTPVVMQTTANVNLHKREFISQGANFYYRKPFTLQDLTGILKAIFTGSYTNP